MTGMRFSFAALISGFASLTALEMTTTSLNRPARPTHPERDTLQIRKPITATNFGEIEVDWEQRTAHTRVITADGEIALSEEFVF